MAQLRFSRQVSGLLAGLMVLQPVMVSTSRAALPASRADYEACQTRDEAGFHKAIDAITTKALQSGVAKVDFLGVVNDEWRRGGIDAVLDGQVDLAIEQVRSETAWSTLLSSPFYKDEAQKLAIGVAERVYRSDAVKKAIEGLATGVSAAVSKNMELATLDAAEPAQGCLQAFLGPRYGSTVAGVVVESAGREFAADPSKNKAQVSAGDLLRESGTGIAGAMVLLVRKQLARMAERIGQRLVGAVLSRLVSLVSGAVGVVLIAKDIWDFRSGVLPIISNEMKDKDSKDKVKAELARTIAEQISEHTHEISSATADRIVEIWHDFKRAHAHVVDLAERNDAFKSTLDTVRPQDLAKFDEIVGLVMARDGEPGVIKRLADGTLHRAANVMPTEGLVIARETRSVEDALNWWALAGDKLPKVVELELFRRAQPQDFTGTSLKRILALADPTAAKRLAAIPREARDNLFELENGDLVPLARALSETELATLSRYLTGLERSAGQRVLRAVALAPAKMQVLGQTHVRDAILGSANQAAAVDMMLRSADAFDPRQMQADIQMAFAGQVSPILIWDKYPIALSSLGGAALVLLMMLRRLLFGTRRRGKAA